MSAAGEISYGIFLWHFPVVKTLFRVSDDLPPAATLAFTIPIAAASYYILERPILRFKYRSWRSKPAQPGVRNDPQSA
jgi:peptidoglycan/LPS O-acetylase OafA/YrhL